MLSVCAVCVRTKGWFAQERLAADGADPTV